MAYPPGPAEILNACIARDELILSEADEQERKAQPNRPAGSKIPRSLCRPDDLRRPYEIVVAHYPQLATRLENADEVLTASAGPSSGSATSFSRIAAGSPILDRIAVRRLDDIDTA